MIIFHFYFLGMKGYFAFHVSVRDGFGHVDKATVQIYLLREDQRVRFVFRSQPAEIRARINRFREVLGKVTGSIGKGNRNVFSNHQIALRSIFKNLIKWHQDLKISSNGNEMFKILVKWQQDF